MRPIKLSNKKTQWPFCVKQHCLLLFLMLLMMTAWSPLLGNQCFGVWGICSSKQWAQQHHQLQKHACNAHVSFKHHLQTTLFACCCQHCWFSMLAALIKKWTWKQCDGWNSLFGTCTTTLSNKLTCLQCTHVSFEHCLQTTLFVVVVDIVDFQC